MIFFNSERRGWDFSKATEEEKDILAALAEQLFPHVLANSIAKVWAKEEVELLKKDMEQEIEHQHMDAEILPFRPKPH